MNDFSSSVHEPGNSKSTSSDRDRCAGHFLAPGMAYWRGRLAGASLLELPIGRVPARILGRGQRSILELSPLVGESVAGLARLARCESVRPGVVVVVAAFAAVLQRYSGQDDFVLGLSLEGTHTVGEEAPVEERGAEILPLRLEGRDGIGFREFVGSVAQALVGARAHREISGAELSEILGREIDDGYWSWEALVAIHSDEEALPSPNPDPQPTRSCYGLALHLPFLNQEPVGRLEYDADRYDSSTIQRLRGHLETFLRAVGQEPASCLAGLPLLTLGERAQLVFEWNDTELEGSEKVSIHGLVSAQAACTPDAIALSWRRERWTYAELDDRANQLARQLRRRGVGRASRVGVALDRCPELVVSLLAVLKAGAAYVPLDRTYPRDRLKFLLDDAAVQLLIARQAVDDALGDAVPRLVVDRDTLSSLDPERMDDSGWMGGGDDLAYLIYTSGSTGRPKGVAIAHRSATAFLRWVGRAFSADELRAVLATTSICFDLSIFELFGPLVHGGYAILVDDALRLAEPSEAGDSKPTLLNTVPSVLEELLRVGAIPASIATINLAGEPLSWPLVEKVYGQLGIRQVNNLYGPSETTTYSTWARIERPSGAGCGSPPIGRPIAGTRVYVADRHLQLVPIGSPGELYIGGAGLAQGYLDRPELTAGRFLPDPFSGRAGERLYWTGDLVRRLPDGNLEHLGRSDDQVKLRGYRIELGEVEAALARHPGVDRAVVVLRHAADGEPCLIAYVRPAGDAPPPAELLRFLRRSLPAYMLPALFVFLPTFPLTSNGKLDRRALAALPPPVAAIAAQPEESAAPVGPLEELLADAWSAALDGRRVGRHDDFFDLGGHSLLAMRVLSRVRAATGMDVALDRCFATPTVASLAAAIEADPGSSRSSVLPLRRVARTGRIPASFSQRGVVLASGLQRTGAGFNVALCLPLVGSLDAEALRLALAQVIERHEALRTGLRFVGDELVQVVLEPDGFALPRIDLAALPRPLGEAQMALLMAGGNVRLDLAAGRLLRAWLLRRSPTEHALLLVVHHAAWDDWSSGLFLGELATFYGSLRGERQASPVELPFQYADYSVSQHDWLHRGRLDRALAYWRDRLAGATDEPLALPTDRRRPAVSSGRGGHYRLELAPALAERLRELSHCQGATQFMVGLAAIAALLARYGRRREVTVGVPIADRGRSELDPLIGLFVNTLVLRLELGGAVRGEELIRGVRERALEAYRHRELPFEAMIGYLHLPRRSARSALTQVMCVDQAEPLPAVRAAGLELRCEELFLGTARYDLEWGWGRSAGGLAATLVYDADLFDSSTAARLAGHLGRLLEELAAAPGRPVGSLDLLSPAERHQLVVEWNATTSAYPRDRMVHSLVEEQAARWPHAGALLYGPEVALTYRELDRRANRLAHRLRAKGAGPEVAVAICAERSAELVVGLLSILKAGAAYVPLDPLHPAEHMRALMGDIGVRMLLAPPHLLPELVADSDVAAVALVPLADEPAPGGEWERGPRTRMSPDNSAYVLFTSGSTGRPKAVCVTHRNVVRLVRGTEYAEWVEGDVVLQFAPIAFDASTFEIWGCLVNGGCLAIVPQQRASLEDLGQVLRSARVSTAWLTAGLFHAMVEHRLGDLGGLRQLLAGGDVLSPAYVLKALAGLPDCRIVNGYGPTEGTTFTCCRPVAEDGFAATGSVLIGRPIANAECHVVDEEGEPLPAGVAGELWIGGDGLARCYLRRPDATAEKFVPNPFPNDPGERLYRTGDLVRLSPQGEIEFLGRIDRQLKIRGFRIEPAEVETALGRHPDVLESVVVASRSGRGEKSLAAYVVCHPLREIQPSDLHRWLAERLPAHLIPSQVVLLASLPLTRNGKVDHGALPEPSREEADTTYVAPRTSIEEVVSAVWTRVLGVEKMGVEDNFFLRGGDSLSAARIASLIHEIFACELPLDLVFREPTISRLCSTLFPSGDLRDRATAAARLLLELEELSDSEVDQALEEERR